MNPTANDVAPLSTLEYTYIKGKAATDITCTVE